jgi:hypothetical protein
MNTKNTFKVFCCFLLSFLLTDIPVALAATPNGMFSTMEIVEHLDRKQTEQKTREFIQRADVQKILVAQGLSPDEVSSRLASLSDSELSQLAGQINHVQAGGDILITILVVVLIIFLVKRL